MKNKVAAALAVCAEPGRMVTDLLWVVAGYVPSSDDGYVSVQITNTTAIKADHLYGGRDALFVEFHDYGHADCAHSIVLTMDEDDEEQFVGWDFDATMAELADGWRS